MTSPFEKRNQTVRIKPAQSVAATVRVPGSKSLTNRLLLLAGLASGTSRLFGALESEDTHYMRAALEQLGVHVDASDEPWVIKGSKNWQKPADPLFVGNAGTAMRFLTPALATQHFPVEIAGNARMAVRPIADLGTSLMSAGVKVEYLQKEGCPPLRITGPIQTDQMTIKGNASSQYLSGLLMALPLLENPPQILLEGDLVSKTYVEMTLACLNAFGINWRVDRLYKSFQLAGGQSFEPSSINIEPDASTASYWFALPLMVGGTIRVLHVPRKSTQGDFGLLKIFEGMGATVQFDGQAVTIEAPRELRGIDVDMNTMSDVAPTLAVVATKAATPTIIRNIGNMRIKECDRIDTLQRAFDALGLNMTSGHDWMRIEPGEPKRSASLNPEEDHRMAMVFALLGLAYGHVDVEQPECVAKTYPNFWREFEAHLTKK